jgi:hypothetical protein
MNRKKKYFIPIFIALFCLMYQAMPIHKLFASTENCSITIFEEDDTESEESDSPSKKLKSEIDDYFSTELITSVFYSQKATKIYYFHHLPKSYEVNAVFAPPPELV